MLEVKDVHYRYAEQPVLQGADLTVQTGEVVSLIGPNGAGKSTLLKCVNGILRSNTGRIALDGRPIAHYHRRELARAMAYVPQQAGSTMPLQVLDMIGLGRAPHRTRASAAHDRDVVMDVIERLGLRALAFRFFGELSGGERQRVLIARALVQEGRLLLLDEPTAGLDLHHQLDTMTIVRSIAKERDVGALITIHDLALAARFSDRLVMLHDGRIRVQGAWRDVLTPRHLEAVYGVSAIIGSEQGMPYVIPKAIPASGGSGADT